MPAISVIVPVYKVEAYLNRCVDSILSQSFRDFELILVDDGSPDNCGSICDAYGEKDSRVRVIHQQNGGLSAARNAGIDWMQANSTAQWIAFVDSDDWVHREYLQRLYDAVQNTGCRMAVCGLFRTGGEAFPQQREEAPRVFAAGDYYCSEEIHGGTTAVAWNKLYHRSLFESLRYPVGKLHEDEFITYQTVFAAETVAVLEAPLYAYYQNPEGIMLSKWNPKRLHVLEATRQQIAFAEKTANEPFRRKAVEQYIMSLAAQLEKAPEEYHKALRKDLRSALKMGRDCGVFPADFDRLWAYEIAYPVKLFWWGFFRGHAALTKITGKEKKDV